MFLSLFRNTAKWSDEELILRYRENNDSRYAGELFRRYSRPAMAIARKYFSRNEDAEDAVMEAFELAFKDMAKYDIKNVRAWLGTVIRHYCLRKKEKARSDYEKFTKWKIWEKIFVEIEEDRPYRNETPSESDLGSVDEELLKKAMEALRSEQEVCVRLFYLEDRSYQEITELTGYEMNKVKSYIQNGKRKLKIWLEDQHG